MERCVKEAVIARIEEAVHNLEGWQRNQNGKIDKLNDKVDVLKDDLRKQAYGMIGIFLGIIINLLVQIAKGG